MLNSKSKKSFWAFRQNRKALRHIFDIQKGDKMIFIIGFAKGENQGIKIILSLNFNTGVV